MRKISSFLICGAISIGILFAGQIQVYAASKTNPSTSATMSTSTASATMSIGYDSADLEIMYVSSQVNRNDSSKTWHPQEFASKSSANS